MPLRFFLFLSVFFLSLAARGEGESGSGHEVGAGLEVTSATELGLLTSHHSAEVRMGAVSALRKQGAQEIDRFLDDPVAAVREGAVEGIYDENIVSALPQLANRAVMIAQSIGPEDEAIPLVAKRGIYAAWRIARPRDIEAVVAIAVDAEIELRVRREALQALLDWNEPPETDPVVGELTPLPEGRALVDEKNLGAALLLWQSLPKEEGQGQVELMELVLKLARKVGQRIPSGQLDALAKGERLSGEARKLAAAMLAEEEDDS